MNKKEAPILVLFLLALVIGCRVEWLNAEAGYPLPAWRNPGEGGFRPGEKLRYSMCALDSFWADPKTAQRMGAGLSDRPRLQKEAVAWNALLSFGWYAFLQIPLLFVLSGLLLWWRFQPVTGLRNRLWWVVTFLTGALIWSAFYRDYSYRTYGL